MMSQQGHHFKMHRTAIVALFLVVATESRSLKSESKVPGVGAAYFKQNNDDRLISRNNSECKKFKSSLGPKYHSCMDIFASAINFDLHPVSDDNVTTYCITDECYNYLYDTLIQLTEKCPDEYYPVVSRSDYLCNHTVILSQPPPKEILDAIKEVCMEYNDVYCMKRWQYMRDIYTNDTLVGFFAVSHSIMMHA